MNAEDLKWVRIVDPIHIPREYVEQIKDRRFSVDKFYQYQKSICVENIDGNLTINVFNLLWVLVDDQNHVKGFCWMVVDPLGESLVINSFSIDNAYWGNGSAVKVLEDKAREIKEGANLSKVYWITRCPRHSERHGWKRSKHTLMEFNDGRNNDGSASEAGG